MRVKSGRSKVKVQWFTETMGAGLHEHSVSFLEALNEDECEEFAEEECQFTPIYE